MRKVARIRRPDGDLWVIVRREDVEPSGGCFIGLPIWLYTRVRWQLSGDKRREVSVQARDKTKRLPWTANLEVHLLRSKEGALLRASHLAGAARDGQFDSAILHAGFERPRRTYQ